MENDWTEVYGDIVSGGEEPFRLYHRTDLSYIVGNKVSLKPDTMLIDKTKYGIEHLSEEQLLSIARSGVTNVTGKNELKIQVRGKILIDIHSEVSKSIDSDYQNAPQNYVVAKKLYSPAGSSAHLGRGMFVKLKPSSTYTLSYSANENAYIWIADTINGTFENRSNKRIVSRVNNDAGDVSITFKSPSSGEIFISFFKYGRPSATNPAEFSNIQLEEGDTKTSSSPYKSSEAVYQMDVEKNERIYSADNLVYSSVTNKPIAGFTLPNTFAGELNTVSVSMNGSVLMDTNVTVRDLSNTSSMTQDEVNSRILFKLDEKECKMDQMNHLLQELIQVNDQVEWVVQVYHSTMMTMET
ncbi:hypothetical protein [Fusibacter sp. JL216-2]|uniref:hypothetical protein n=1 Tax=Fusibacter sp. JL216-2 TaxID=3071453 RepID=UPI003D331C43